MALQSFRVSVADEILEDLRQRLAHTRWPDEPAGAGWQYGSALAVVRDLVEYWRDCYDWRRQEAALNSWSDCDGDVLSVFTRDELLTDVMLYWATSAIGRLPLVGAAGAPAAGT